MNITSSIVTNKTLLRLCLLILSYVWVIYVGLQFDYNYNLNAIYNI